MGDDLTNPARDLSLEPPLPRRISTVESADQAEGIFDLYGGARDSWQSSASARGPGKPLDRYEADEPGHIEELAESPKSPASWSGPIVALSTVTTSRIISISVPPPIKVTPAITPERTRSLAETRDSTFTSISSNSPTQPSIRRHSPRLAGRSNNTSASASQVSVAGSSQYPGEENDAFHVRSTCESTLIILTTLYRAVGLILMVIVLRCKIGS